MISPLTRAQLERTAKIESGQAAADLKAAADGSADEAAIARLSERPSYDALLRTTCVATQLEAGHARTPCRSVRGPC